jgi:hypothetical protein
MEQGSKHAARFLLPSLDSPPPSPIKNLLIGREKKPKDPETRRWALFLKRFLSLGPHNRGNPAQKEDRSGLEKIGCARKKGYVDTYLTLFFGAFKLFVGHD